MDSNKPLHQSSQTGSSNNDTALTSDTDAGSRKIDNMPSPMTAVGNTPRRRPPPVARDEGEGCGPSRAEGAGRRGVDPLQAPHSPPSEAHSNRTSLTQVDIDVSHSPILKQNGSDGHRDGSDCDGVFAGALEGHPQAVTGMESGGHQVAQPAHQIAQPVGNSGREFPPPLSEEIKNLCAIDVVEDYERYHRGYCYELDYYKKDKNKILRGQCGTSLDFPALSERPGWKGFLDPEGTRYFLYDIPGSPVPVVTDGWLYDEECYEQVEHYRKAVFSYLQAYHGSLPKVEPSYFKLSALGSPRKDNPPPGGEGEENTMLDYFQDHAPIVLVLELRLSGNCGYYFVDHSRKRLFWLDDYDFTWAAGEVHVEHSDSVIGMEMKRHYWRHNEYFPHLYSFTEGDLEEIDDMLGFTFGDALTSNTTAVNSYTLDELKHMMDIMTRHGQKPPSKRRKSVGERRTLCRVVSTLYHERFLNLHGERGARLDSTQSIHYSQRRRKKWAKRADVKGRPNENRPWYQRFLVTFFSSKQAENGDEMISVDADPEPSPLATDMHSSSLFMYAATVAMFGGPLVHANKLREISLDQIVNKKLLTKYTEKMVAEWRDVALYGTVLLSTNVSFLAIQSVDGASTGQDPKTPAQRASYFSILASLGTIISSLVMLILVRHREVMGHELIAERSQSRWGLEALALMYGTPFSLVIWAFLGFFVSFAILWFESHDGVVIGIVVVCLAFFAIFLGWAVSASYSKEEPYKLVTIKAAEKVRETGGKVRRGTIDAADKVVTAGAMVGRGTLNMADIVRRGTLSMAKVAIRQWPSSRSSGDTHRRSSQSRSGLPQYASEMSTEPRRGTFDASEPRPRRRSSGGSPA